MSDAWQDTLEWLYAREARLGMDFRLERLAPVLGALGNPESRLPVVHVAGTNGKGSVCAFLESVWRRAGLKTGLYTSPHLLFFNERFRINGVAVASAILQGLVQRVRSAMETTGESLTFFEIATLVGFLAMDEAEVDVAIVEAGLGGRLDATNVLPEKLATVITSIARDHEEFLGHDERSIAREKAGIFRPRCPAFVGRVDPEIASVLSNEAATIGCSVEVFGRDFQGENLADLNLQGPHQADNAALAVAVVRGLAGTFEVSESQLSEGLKAARWPGRFEQIAAQPAVIVDGAHNPAAAAALSDTLAEREIPRPRILLFAAMRDKRWQDILDALLPQFDAVVLAPLDMPRAAAIDDLGEYISDRLPVSVARSLPEALRLATDQAGESGSVVISGSIFLVAQLYRAAGGAAELFMGDDLAA